MQSDAETRVSAVVDALYRAYFAGDTEGMLATMAEDVDVRFLGRPAASGIDETRAFLTASNASLEDLDFKIRRTIIDGEWVAVLWDETATALGRPYENQGVDVFRVVDGQVMVLRVNNDVAKRRKAFATDVASPETS